MSRQLRVSGQCLSRTKLAVIGAPNNIDRKSPLPAQRLKSDVETFSVEHSCSLPAAVGSFEYFLSLEAR